MSLRLLSRVVSGSLAVVLLLPAASAQRMVRAEITLAGLSSGGLITFELHHTNGVARLSTTLGFFEPPFISAQGVAGHMRPSLPAGWTILSEGPTIIVTPSGPERFLDARVCSGSSPCPRSASLDSPQVVAGHTWTMEVFRRATQRAALTDIMLTGISSGGPITFELHHTTGVARLSTTLGFLEPPFITAFGVAGHMRPRLPRGWTITSLGPRIIVFASGPERLLDCRVCPGFDPCPPSASLATPQVVAGHTWTK